MIVKPELLKRIKEHFNLNIYETKVWLALLSKGVATAGEIAEISNVPRSRTYDVLESLEKEGFAILKLGKPLKYIAVDPGIVIDRIRNNVIKDAEERAEFLVNIKDNNDYKQLVLLHKQGIEPINPEEISGLIRGKSNLHNHIKNLMAKASDSVILATTAEAIAKKKWLKGVIASLAKKGVSVKIMVKGSEDEIKAMSKELKADIKASDLDARFCIIDGKEMLFMLTPETSHEDSDYGVWVNSKFFVNSMSSLFNTAWKKVE